jgi:hypothetical protein
MFFSISSSDRYGCAVLLRYPELYGRVFAFAWRKSWAHDRSVRGRSPHFYWPGYTTAIQPATLSWFGLDSNVDGETQVGNLPYRSCYGGPGRAWLTLVGEVV